MLSVIDIIRALSLLIEEKFPDFPVVDRDLTEGFPRPCYFIDVEGLVTEFQSTLPRGSDILFPEHNVTALQISIHAPSRERPIIDTKRLEAKEFQSTLPRGSDALSKRQPRH